MKTTTIDIAMTSHVSQPIGKDYLESINRYQSKALNREVKPYGFFQVKTLREYHHALGRGLLPIAPCLFR